MIDRRRTCRAVAASEAVGAHDEVFVRVERLVWANEPLPPTWFGIRLGAMCVTGGRQTSMEQNSIALVLVQLAPGLVGDVELW